MDSMLVLALILSLSIALQLLAAGLALRLIPLSSGRVSWILISTALVLMSARRGVTLGRLIQGGARIPIDPWAEAIALAISACMAAGMYLIAALFTERRKLEEHLRRSEKLEALGQLAGGVAHDFNNQLQVILGQADELARGATDRGQRESAELIVTAAQRSAALTSNLLAFARKSTRPPTPVDVHEVIAEVEALLSRTLDRAIEVRHDLRAGPCVLSGDPAQLQNMLLNLALNARDAMPCGGRLTFSTEVVALDEREALLRHRDLGPGRYIAIGVTDTGTGISPDTRAHLFEPFFTTKSSGAGTGLGLASVYGTVRAHRGAIEVESAAGVGSTFRVYLPASGEPTVSAPAAAARAEPPSRPTGTGRVLVVEDESVIRDMLVSMLRRLGHEATSCADGIQAIDHYRRAWREIDLVILDTIMPRLGGAETLTALVQINPAVRVIVCSGYTDSDPPGTALGASLVGYLHKPFVLAELSAMLSRTIPAGPLAARQEGANASPQR